FAKFKEWGIAGIKIDFMAREDQWMVEWYHRIIKTAAIFNLMVDFHGAYKPTGFRRTYPNLMTREGVLGNEYNKWSDRVTPEHNCTLVYTRGLLGEMDYTPGGFLNRHPGDFRIALQQPDPIPTEVQGTRAHQLALFVVFESPITVVCEHPDHIKGQAGEDFLRLVPTVWDETIGLAGAIGSYAVVAKRSGNEWYVAAITNSEARELEIPLQFLDEGGWNAEIWADGPDVGSDATDLLKDEQELQSTGKLVVKLASGGGAVVRLTPAE
ncbi:MAG TPA: glycoside hydrolase family 97 catalytic domain-containing protein, partial [Opitutales bacterium]|nr:glycoside hydrolase family 97 catalytic domain-containing protein [Opitutales bacterium]